MYILVVEDNAADARLIEKAIRDSSDFYQVFVVPDGRAAMAFVHQEEPYTTARRPDLILLDLNLPYKNGGDVLMECKADPLLRTIPIVIWTSTESDAEVRRLYALGAAAYCVKPSGLAEYLSLIQVIVNFWGRQARLARE